MSLYRNLRAGDVVYFHVDDSPWEWASFGYPSENLQRYVRNGEKFVLLSEEKTYKPQRMWHFSYAYFFAVTELGQIVKVELPRKFCWLL